MREGSNSDLLFVFSIDDSKQNATSLLTPVSNIVFDVLSSGTLGFARAIRREDHPLQPESPYGPIWTNDKKLTLREGVQEQLSVICCKSSLNRRRAGNRTTALEAELSLVQGHQTKMATDPPT